MKGFPCPRRVRYVAWGAQQGRSASSEVRDSGTTICVVRRIGGRKSHPGFHRVRSCGGTITEEFAAAQYGSCVRFPSWAVGGAGDRQRSRAPRAAPMARRPPSTAAKIARARSQAPPSLSLQAVGRVPDRRRHLRVEQGASRKLGGGRLSDWWRHDIGEPRRCCCLAAGRLRDTTSPARSGQVHPEHAVIALPRPSILAEAPCPKRISTIEMHDEALIANWTPRSAPMTFKAARCRRVARSGRGERHPPSGHRSRAGRRDAPSESRRPSLRNVDPAAFRGCR